MAQEIMSKLSSKTLLVNCKTGTVPLEETFSISSGLFLSKISVDLSLDPDLPGVQIQAKVKSSGQTGVEMEALTAVSIAGLTVYDMMKAVDKTMEIGAIRLKFKDGGKSGRFEAS